MQVAIINTSICNHLYHRTDFRWNIWGDMVCAGEPQGGKDACFVSAAHSLLYHGPRALNLQPAVSLGVIQASHKHLETGCAPTPSPPLCMYESKCGHCGEGRKFLSLAHSAPAHAPVPAGARLGSPMVLCRGTLVDHSSVTQTASGIRLVL